jgi:oxygen-dependent protoporphyrinogen oxidase
VTRAVGIVGAGITGLRLADALRQRGIEAVVLEAEPEPGGAIRTRVVDGRVLELGPQRTRLTAPMRRLVDELGLAGEVIEARPDLPLFVYRSGRLRRAPLSIGQLLGTDLLGGRAKLRVLLEPFTGRPRGDETVEHCLVRRFGRVAYEDLLGPLFGGLYASDPARMLVRHALAPLLRELGAGRSAVAALVRHSLNGGPPAAPCSFRRGMRALTDALHARVADRVLLGTPVQALRRDGPGWIIEAAGSALPVRQVVLTTPADASAGLLEAAAPEAAARLRRLRYNTVTIVHLLAACDIDGLGYQVSFAERLETRGVTFNHSLFRRDGVYTAFLGGARSPSIATLPDADVAALAVREFHGVLGALAQPIQVSRARIPAWDRSWEALEGLRLPPGVHLCANYESRVGIPGRLGRAERLAAALQPD